MPTERILVTGSGGVLGQAFKAIAPDYPEYEWQFATSRDGDLTNWDDAIGLVDLYGLDYIIHCAAISGGVGISKNHPATLLRDNILMSLNILEAARFTEVKKVVMTLSGGMYPPHLSVTQPMLEHSIHDAPPHASNYAYAHAKRLIEPMIRAYREEYGLNVIGLVPDAMYGEHDNFNLEDCNMTAALIRKFYEASRTGEDVEIWGDGTPWRQLSYAPDVARAYMVALKEHDSSELINITTSEVAQVWEVASYLSQIAGFCSDRVECNPDKPNGPQFKFLDTERFKKLAPEFNWTPLRDGLERTYRWYEMAMLEDPNQIRMGSKVK